jgi:integrase
LLGLRWEDVDLVNGRLYVRESYVRGVFGTPKSGKPREVPLSNQARQALETHREARQALAVDGHPVGERVFCDAQGRPFKMGIMLSKLWRMCRLAKLSRKVGWHTRERDRCELHASLGLEERISPVGPPTQEKSQVAVLLKETDPADGTTACDARVARVRVGVSTIRQAK